MATSGLLQWQAGKETTWGTPVTATARLMGVQAGSFIRAANRSEIYPDVRGSLQPAYLAGLEQIAGEGKLELLATFEDICYIFDNAFGEATPTGTGPYVRTYAAPIASVPTPRVLTVVHGSSQSGAGIYKLEGGLVNTVSIKGATGKPTMVSCDLIGQTVTTGSLTALSDRTVEVLMGQPWLVYLDAVGGTIGSTQLTTTAVAFELSWNLNRVLVWSMDSLTPDMYEHNPWTDVKLGLTLRFNSSSKTEVDAIVAQSAVYQKQVRLSQTSGTKVCQLNFAGTLKEPPQTFEDEDGVLTVTLEMFGTYNSALSNSLTASITNGVSTLP